MPATATSRRPRSASSAGRVGGSPRHQSSSGVDAGERALRQVAGQAASSARRRCRARAGASRNACGQRLAQRPGRQQPAVADAALVEHQHLDVALERQVLQAVVADDDVDVGMRLQQGVAGGRRDRAPTTTGTPVAALQQQRLVADLRARWRRGRRASTRRAVSAVAARDDAGRVAAALAAARRPRSPSASCRRRRRPGCRRRSPAPAAAPTRSHAAREQLAPCRGDRVESRAPAAAAAGARAQQRSRAPGRQRRRCQRDCDAVGTAARSRRPRRRRRARAPLISAPRRPTTASRR